MEMLLADMERYLSKNSPQWNDFLKEEEVVSNDYQVSPRQRGIFRNPEHAIYERQKRQYRPTGRHEDNSKRNEFELTDSKSDNQSSKHPKLNFPVFEEGSDTLKSLQDCELDVEPLYDVEPIYDEEQGKGQECWPEQEFILAALNGGNLDAPNPLQTGICRSERSKELAEFSSIQDLQQKNVSPGDTNIMAYNAMQPNREEKYLEMSAVDPYIFHFMESSTANCMSVLGNSHIWSTEYKDMPSFGNNFSEELVEVSNIQDLQQERENNIAPYVRIPGQLEDRGSTSLCPNWHAFQDQQHVCQKACLSLSLLTKEEPAKSLANKTSKVPEDGDKPKLVDYQGGVDEEYSRSNKQDVLIFDPGGHASIGQQICVMKMFNEMVRNKMVKIDEIKMFVSRCGKMGQLQLHGFHSKILAIKLLLKQYSQLRTKVFLKVVNQGRAPDHNIQRVSEEIRAASKISQQNVDSVGVGRQLVSYKSHYMISYKYHYMVLEEGRPDTDMNKSTRQASRKNSTIYVFDPGGNLSCLNGILLAVSTRTPKLQQIQDFLKGKDLYTYGAISTGVESLTSPKCMEIYVNRKQRSVRSTMRTWFIFKEGDMSGMAS